MVSWSLYLFFLIFAFYLVIDKFIIYSILACNFYIDIVLYFSFCWEINKILCYAMLCYVMLYSLSTILYKLKQKEGKKLFWLDWNLKQYFYSFMKKLFLLEKKVNQYLIVWPKNCLDWRKNRNNVSYSFTKKLFLSSY